MLLARSVSMWRKLLARSAVNRKVDGSNPSRDALRYDFPSDISVLAYKIIWLTGCMLTESMIARTRLGTCFSFWELFFLENKISWTDKMFSSSVFFYGCYVPYSLTEFAKYLRAYFYQSVLGCN